MKKFFEALLRDPEFPPLTQGMGPKIPPVPPGKLILVASRTVDGITKGKHYLGEFKARGPLGPGLRFEVTNDRGRKMTYAAGVFAAPDYCSYVSSFKVLPKAYAMRDALLLIMNADDSEEIDHAVKHASEVLESIGELGE